MIVLMFLYISLHLFPFLDFYNWGRPSMQRCADFYKRVSVDEKFHPI